VARHGRPANGPGRLLVLRGKQGRLVREVRAFSPGEAGSRVVRPGTGCDLRFLGATAGRCRGTKVRATLNRSEPPPVTYYSRPSAPTGGREGLLRPGLQAPGGPVGRAVKVWMSGFPGRGERPRLKGPQKRFIRSGACLAPRTANGIASSGS